MDAVAHPSCGDGEHPPELSAAENSQGGTRRNDLTLAAEPSGEDRLTADVPDGLSRSARGETRGLGAQLGRELDRMDTASSPALVAPALPIARVPTGAARHLHD